MDMVGRERQGPGIAVPPECDARALTQNDMSPGIPRAMPGAEHGGRMAVHPTPATRTARRTPLRGRTRLENAHLHPSPEPSTYQAVLSQRELQGRPRRSLHSKLPDCQAWTRGRAPAAEVGTWPVVSRPSGSGARPEAETGVPVNASVPAAPDRLARTVPAPALAQCAWVEPSRSYVGVPNERFAQTAPERTLALRKVARSSGPRSGSVRRQETESLMHVHPAPGAHGPVGPPNFHGRFRPRLTFVALQVPSHRRPAPCAGQAGCLAEPTQYLHRRSPMNP
jgi:hypothetical protein